MQSLNTYKSFIKKIYDLAETHGGLIKLKLKENEGLFAARLITAAGGRAGTDRNGQEQLSTELKHLITYLR